jgi:hypothetical protein
LAMKRAVTSALMIVFLGAGSVFAFGASASAASTNPVAVWPMGEGKGATVMIDTSGHHLDGKIGNKITTAYIKDRVQNYSFPFVDNRSPYDPGHVVTVPDNSLLDPGTGNYSITVSFDFTINDRNIIQKGQATTPGGFFKMEIANGIIDCLFRGSGGDGGVGSPPGLVKAGTLHKVACIRTATQVQMKVDGRVVSTTHHATGSISNSLPLSIGGKTVCNGTKVQCDPFVGTINWAEIDRPS